MDAGELRRRPEIADREVNHFYTSAAEGRAQSYDPRPSGSDAAPEEAIMRPSRQAERARYAAIRSVLGELPPDVRAMLEMVYGHGAGVLDGEAGTVEGVTQDRRGKQDRLGLLRIALQPVWGHGSYVRIAVRQEIAIVAFRRRYGGTPATTDAVLAFLCDEAGEGQQKASFLAKLRNDCERLRAAALYAFDDVHREHTRSRRDARDAARRSELDAATQMTARAAEKRETRPVCLRWSAEKRAELQAAAQARLAELDAGTS